VTPVLVFDLDGTLVDSLPGIAAALNAALADHGLPVHPSGKVREFVGSGAFQLCRRAIPANAPDALAHEVLKAFGRHYPGCWPSGSRPYPGIEPLVSRLTDAGTRMAVLSNKPDAFTREMVDRLFPRRPFSLVRGQIDGSPRKPDPAAVRPVLDFFGITPAAAVLIGDSEIDRETAESAGIPFIGVTWGYRPAEVLGPHLARSVSELAHALESR
jgi:phosphoglycolate phosphatase